MVGQSAPTGGIGGAVREAASRRGGVARICREPVG
jgi:hypothetical protein